MFEATCVNLPNVTTGFNVYLLIAVYNATDATINQFLNNYQSISMYWGRLISFGKDDFESLIKAVVS